MALIQSKSSVSRKQYLTMKKTNLMSRFASFGLATVLLVLAIYTICATTITLEVVSQASESVHMSNLYQQAHYYVSDEDSLLHQYYLNPNADTWAEYQAAASRLVSVLHSVQHDGDNGDRAFVRSVMTEQEHFQRLTLQMSAAITTHQMTIAKGIHDKDIDVVFDRLEEQVNIAENQDHILTTQSLEKLSQTQQTIITSTSVVFAISLLLLTLFWKVLRSYQRKLNQATHMQLASLERAALTDPLTTLGNHRAFQEDVQHALEHAQQHEEALTLALIDVDEFKFINDTRGHPHGDRVLKGLATLLRNVHPAAAAYRLGGDEFALLVPAQANAETLKALESLCQQAPLHLFDATLSIGMAFAGMEVLDAESLRAQADAALYEAKRRGHNRVATAETIQGNSPILAPSKARALQRLLAEGKISVAFQPIWDLKRGGLLAFEALTRPAAEYGFSGPQEAFDIAEQLGYIADLDLLCLRAILERAAQVRPSGLLFVNLSPQTLEQERLPGNILVQAVRAAGLIPDDVVLEITERSIVRPEVVVREAKRLRSLGFGLALDDIGSGNAGLEVLSHLPVDFAKIDRSVVVKALSDRSARGVLSGITAIARETAAYVIAEGIETVEMFDFVQQMGAHGVQGYLLGRPSESLPQIATLKELLPLAQVA